MGNVCCQANVKENEQTINEIVGGHSVQSNLDDGVVNMPNDAPVCDTVLQHAPDQMYKIKEAQNELQSTNNKPLINFSIEILNSREFKNLSILGPYKNNTHNTLYYGNYKDGKKHGFGTLLWETDKKFYYGEFKDNVPHGKGI